MPAYNIIELDRWTSITFRRIMIVFGSVAEHRFGIYRIRGAFVLSDFVSRF